MSRRFGRALRGVSVACLLMFGLLALPAMAQVRQEGAAPGTHGGVMPLAAGTSHACAVRSDGGVACWGKNYDGQATPPAGTFIALGAGGDHSCGIRGNGSVACWGRNDQGQASAPSGTFTALAAGTAHTCGLRSDGGVQCWGAGYTGWQPSGTYVALSASGNYTCALQPDGGLKCWRVGQALLEQPVAGVFTAVSVGGSKYACGLHADSSITCWDDVGTVSQAPSTGFTSVSVSGSGNQRCGGRPDGSVTCWVGSYEYPAPATGQFVALSAGFDYTCGLRSYGSVGCWGNTYDVGIAPQDAFWIGDIASGVSNGCHVGPDGQLACWGYNPYGWNPPAGRFVEVSSGERYNCARQDDGQNLCWGWDDNAHGQRNIPAIPLRQLDVGSIHGCAVAAQGNATCWGSDNYGQAVPPAGLFKNVSAGLVHSCGVLADGTGACWGYNGDGETDVPALSTGLGYLSIQAGERQSCGLRSDGAVACWGFDAGEPYASAPPSGYFRALSVGAYHSCAIRADGTLACWGEDWSQQLSAPTGTYISVSSGSYASCAIRTDGTRLCWGINSGTPLVLDPQNLPALGLNQPYTAQLTVYSTTGAPATATTSFAVVAGNLPAGLSLTADGMLSGTPTAAGSSTVTIEGNGGNGFAVQKEYVLVVDSTPPVVAPQVTGTLGDNGWYVGTTRLAWSIADDESSIAVTSGCNWLTLSTDQTPRDYDCTVESAGGTASATVNLKVDVTAPTTTLTANPGATSNTYDATFEFAGQDATAGLGGFECSLDNAAYAACASPMTVTVAAGNHNFKVRAVDAAGLRDQTPVSHSWLVDPTPPTITPTVNGLMGYNGWHVSDVQVSWNVDDGGSPITSTSGCNTVTLTTDSIGASFTCTATSAGGTTSKTVTVKRDTIAPSITAAATTAANAAGWYNSAVTVAFTCSDSTSGGITCPAAQVLNGEGTLSSTARTVTDAAGNSATSNVVTAKIDRTAPTLAPSVAATLLLNSTAQASANGSDALSGVATQQCAPLASSSVGSKSVSCTVTDAAGNSANASATYRVTYGFVGFTSPVANLPTLNVLKAGRSTPFRWRLVDAQGAPVSNLAAVSMGVTAISCPSATENRISVYGGGNSQLQNLGNGYYQLDWSAPSGYRNTCKRLNLDLGDGEAHPTQFKFN